MVQMKKINLCHHSRNKRFVIAIQLEGEKASCKDIRKDYQN